MTMLQMYGIKNCDTVRKARKWLEQNQIEYDFVDLRDTELPQRLLDNWIASAGLEQLINKKSTSWRGLSDEEKTELSHENAASLIQRVPTLIKRPVLVCNDQVHVGFKSEKYQDLLL